MAYNHGRYIRDTLEGFVSQETNFPFEVFVHDDASIDNTVDIIKEYADKYPNIIKPILQKENQYSQNVRIFKNYIAPLISGKYIAICEGDDYWCDKKKLQMQVDWLENNPEYVFCVHNTRIINCLDGTESLVNASKEDKDISTEEIIQWKKGLFHTSSYMYRSEFAEIPCIFSVKGIGDYPRALYLATCGKVRYLSKVMSVYRYMVPESWSQRMYKSEDAGNKYIAHCQNRITMLKKVDEYTSGKYTECIRKVIRRNEYNILYLMNDLRKIKKEYKDIYRQSNFKNRLYIHIRHYCPVLLKMYHKILK